MVPPSAPLSVRRRATLLGRASRLAVAGLTACLVTGAVVGLAGPAAAAPQVAAVLATGVRPATDAGWGSLMLGIGLVLLTVCVVGAVRAHLERREIRAMRELRGPTGTRPSGSHRDG